MRAAIAIRVSPRPQENVRYSPEIQEQLCREWCAAQGHEVVTVVSDILVSGGSVSRFDSIFAALEQHTPQLFVVSDLSRWTRDKPSRFWAIKALLEDQGVSLVSVSEPWLGSETPFSDTVTTATVEMNYQERLRLKAKTSAGVRKAWAAGKRWGRPMGWTFDRTTRTWSQDTQRIEQFYSDWLAGVSGYEMAQRYGIFETNIRKHIRAESQREIVGVDVWEAAQTARPIRGLHRDAIRSSIYRSLLVCPFCGGTLQQTSHWGHYKCHKHRLVPHGWWSLSARAYVTPVVSKYLDRLHTPVLPVASGSQAMPVRDYQKELDRLSLVWAKGRLSDAAYDKAVSAIETDRSKAAHPQPEPPDAIALVRNLSFIDLEDRDPETGNLANRVLCAVIQKIEIAEDRTASIVPFEWVSRWET